MNQENLKGGSFGYASGSVCPKTGSYKSTNNYVDTIVAVAKGDKFPSGADGGKTTWTALSTATDGNKTGFDSVRATAGAA